MKISICCLKKMLKVKPRRYLKLKAAFKSENFDLSKFHSVPSIKNTSYCQKGGFGYYILRL